MTMSASRRRALTVGVASLAATVGLGVAWQRHVLHSLSTDAMAALWAAEFQSPSGDSLRLQSFQGKPLVLNFWATWCPPCVEEMPLLDAFHRQNSANGWQVLGLAIDQPSQVRQFLKQFPVSYPVALGGLGGTTLGQQLGNADGGLPFTVVLDAQGNLKQRKLGKLSDVDIKSWI